MNSKIYKIKPLIWEGTIKDDYDSSFAFVPFGHYKVTKQDEDSSYPFMWGYHFKEYFDESEDPCNSFEEGKLCAEKHWQERIVRGLEEIKE